MKVLCSIALASLLVIAPAAAQIGTPGFTVKSILENQREIRTETERRSGAYTRFGESALSQMHSAQDRIFHLLEGVQAIEQLNDEQQVQLVNAIEEVKAVIANNEDSRLECWREPKTGTTMREKRCATVAERARIRMESQDWKNETD